MLKFRGSFLALIQEVITSDPSCDRKKRRLFHPGTTRNCVRSLLNPFKSSSNHWICGAFGLELVQYLTGCDGSKQRHHKWRKKQRIACQVGTRWLHGVDRIWKITIKKQHPNMGISFAHSIFYFRMVAHLYTQIPMTALLWTEALRHEFPVLVQRWSLVTLVSPCPRVPKGHGFNVTKCAGPVLKEYQEPPKS